MVPAVPLNVTVAVPVASDDAAVNDTCCGVPGVSVKLPGMATTPLGRPEIATLIEPVNPFNAVAETEIVCAPPPASSVIAPELKPKLKSGAGGGSPRNVRGAGDGLEPGAVASGRG